MLISMIYVWTGQHLGCNFRAFCKFCTLMSRNISQEYSFFFCKIFVLFAGIFNYVIKSVFIQSLTFRVITQFGQQWKSCLLPLNTIMYIHLFYKTIFSVRKRWLLNILQLQMISIEAFPQK